MPNDEGITPLHNAVCAGHHHIVKFLLDFGVNVNAADSDGWSVVTIIIILIITEPRLLIDCGELSYRARPELSAEIHTRHERTFISSLQDSSSLRSFLQQRPPL